MQQILSYFLVPLVIAGPLAFALSTALLGYFENFANTSISIDITYLGVAVLLFVLYLLVTYRVSWQIIENKSNTRVAYPTILVLCYTDIKVVQEVDTYETVCQIDLEKLTFIVVVDDF